MEETLIDFKKRLSENLDQQWKLQDSKNDKEERELVRLKKEGLILEKEERDL